MEIHKLCLYFACILAYTQGLAIITNWPRHHRLPHSSRPRGRRRTLWQRTGPGRRSAPTTASRAPRPAVPAPPGRQGAPCQFPRGRGGRGSTFPRRRRSLSRLRSRCCACVVGVPEMTVFGGGCGARAVRAPRMRTCRSRSVGGGRWEAAAVVLRAAMSAFGAAALPSGSSAAAGTRSGSSDSLEKIDMSLGELGDAGGCG